MATKANRQRWMAQDAHKLLITFCTESKTFLHDFEVETIHGKLTIGISRDHLVRGLAPTLTLFCRFAEPARARAAGIDCNPFSGKWNHHLVANHNLEEIVLFIRSIACGHSDTKASTSTEPSTASASV